MAMPALAERSPARLGVENKAGIFNGMAHIRLSRIWFGLAPGTRSVRPPRSIILPERCDLGPISGPSCSNAALFPSISDLSASHLQPRTWVFKPNLELQYQSSYSARQPI